MQGSQQEKRKSFDNMRFIFFSNSKSPHQLPLAKELVKLMGVKNYKYIYTTKLTNECGHINGYKQTKNIGIIVELLNTKNEIINVSYKMLYMNTDEKFAFLEQLVKEINKLEELNNTLQKEENYEQTINK